MPATPIKASFCHRSYGCFWRRGNKERLAPRIELPILSYYTSPLTFSCSVYTLPGRRVASRHRLWSMAADKDGIKYATFKSVAPQRSLHFIDSLWTAFVVKCNINKNTNRHSIHLRAWSSSSPFIFSRNTGCSTDAYQLPGQKFRCCGTAPVEHCAVYVTRTDQLDNLRDIWKHNYLQRRNQGASWRSIFFTPCKYSYLLTYLLRTLPLSPPKGSSKTQNGRFPYRIALLLKKVCYKVSLCENCQRQSCKAFIGPTNRAKVIGRGDPFSLKFSVKMTALERNRRFPIYFRP